MCAPHLGVAWLRRGWRPNRSTDGVGNMGDMTGGFHRGIQIAGLLTGKSPAVFNGSWLGVLPYDETETSTSWSIDQSLIQFYPYFSSAKKPRCSQSSPPSFLSSVKTMFPVGKWWWCSIQHQLFIHFLRVQHRFFSHGKITINNSTSLGSKKNHPTKRTMGTYR